MWIPCSRPIMKAVSSSNAPLIAINGLLVPERPAVLLDHRYADAVLRAGGIPLVIPPLGGPSDVAALLDRVDGLLLTGGDDFETEPLGLGPTHPAAVVTPRAKQDFDFLLTRAAIARDMPVLGICYGMQLLGLAAGASLLQHLPEDRPGCREHRSDAAHPVRVAAGSKLARCLEVDELDVVSRHHQALADVPAPWRVTGHDDEGLVEAIERPDLTYALGVQWHPELAPTGSAHDRLFRGLVNAAGLSAQRGNHAFAPPVPARTS